ncbi:MAG: glutamate 5-kinase [Hyphomicrobiales bacterium]|nr:glutamate 5-kinase [Hyphomicrobiales bacterium]PCH51070.1 MAG: glutamate 5-kinase [Hyphomicrobiales bacterium]PCH51344.1 MAG: glutamate 5-kinase [Hyphomicrobiales bacterium]
MIEEKNNQDSTLKNFKRIVIKIGSALLVDRKTGLKTSWLNSLITDIALLKRQGHEVLIVSSGSIALGRAILGLKQGRLKLEESQAAASVGQISLASSYLEALAKHNLVGGQILLTLGDTQERRRYLNARATIETLLKLGAVPIINENDSVATSEIRYGDNDRLAARVATMTTSNLLVLLSDIDGLYSAPPNENPNAKFIPVVKTITSQIEAMAGDVGTELSSGGMVTKIEAGKIATSAGTAMVITSGKKMHPIAALANDEKATWFKPSENPISAKRKWIAGQLEVSGKLFLDEGAIKALHSGKSLLPAGINKVSGDFKRGDIVAIIATSDSNVGIEIARGIVAYDAQEACKIVGHKSTEILDILGHTGRSEMVHRDDLVLSK